MKKTLLTIEPEILDFLKADAEKERRTMSAQVCALLELCQKYGGYSALVEKLTVNRLVQESRTAEQDPTTQKNQSASGRKPGRPKKPGTITIAAPMISSLYLVVINKRTKKRLIVYAPDYAAVSEYIKDALDAGNFEHEDIQREYTDNRDSFIIQPAGGDSPDHVREIYADVEFYDGWMDLSGIGEPAEDGGQSAQNPPEESPRKQRTRRATLKQFMAVEWDDVQPDQVKQLYKKVASNKEVEAAVQKYIKDSLPSFYNPDPKQLEDGELLNILQELQQEIYARQRNDGGTEEE